MSDQRIEHEKTLPASSPTVMTPVESACNLDVNDKTSSDPTQKFTDFPQPTSVYVIRSASCGRYLTLLDGHVVLAPRDNIYGSIHWSCTNKNGWINIKNIASGNSLGHRSDDGIPGIVCTNGSPEMGRSFFVCGKVGGGCTLMSPYVDEFRRIGLGLGVDSNNLPLLTKLEHGIGDAIVWKITTVCTTASPLRSGK